MKPLTSFIDLTQRPPRSFRVRLGGLVVLARMLDKGRAALSKRMANTITILLPINIWCVFLALIPSHVEGLAAGKGDGEMLEWIRLIPGTPARAVGNRSLGRPSWKNADRTSDAETLALFAGYLGQLSKTREDVNTWFEAIELDDYASFGGNA